MSILTVTHDPSAREDAGNFRNCRKRSANQDLDCTPWMRPQNSWRLTVCKTE
jgi:hypothetical protein